MWWFLINIIIQYNPENQQQQKKIEQKRELDEI